MHSTRLPASHMNLILSIIHLSQITLENFLMNTVSLPIGALDSYFIKNKLIALSKFFLLKVEIFCGLVGQASHLSR